MNAVHCITMQDNEYREWMAFLNKLQRDTVFESDAKRFLDTFKRDIVVPPHEEPEK